MKLLFVSCLLTVLFLASSSNVVMGGILSYEELISLPYEANTIKQEEYDSYRENFPKFANCEKELSESYKDALDAIGLAGEGWLMMNQADWSKERVFLALKSFPPKGSSAYINALVLAGQERIAWLKELAKKGTVIYINDYAYRKNGFNGMLTLFKLPGNKLDFTIETRDRQKHFPCEIKGTASFTDGKAVFKSKNGYIKLEMMDLGKWVKITSDAEQKICGGGHIVGTYEEVK